MCLSTGSYFVLRDLKVVGLCLDVRHDVGCSFACRYLVSDCRSAVVDRVWKTRAKAAICGAEAESGNGSRDAATRLSSTTVTIRTASLLIIMYSEVWCLELMDCLTVTVMQWHQVTMKNRRSSCQHIRVHWQVPIQPAQIEGYATSTPEFIPPSNSDHHAGVLIPAQQWVIPTHRLRILHIRPSPEEVLMRHNFRESAGNGAVDVLHDAKVGGKEDVKVALMNLWR